MTQTTDERALDGMLDEYEELSSRLAAASFRPAGRRAYDYSPPSAALQELQRHHLDRLWSCIVDHRADLDRRANEEPDTMANLGVRY